MRVNLGRRSEATGGRWRFLVLFLLAIVLVVSFTRGLGALGDLVTSPVYAAKAWFLRSESFIPAFFKSRVALEREIGGLKASLDGVPHRDAELAALRAENELLREGKKEDAIFADVVRRPNETPYDVLVINRGAEDGIKESALVYGPEKSVIGRVERVYAQSSLVVLFSTPDVTIPAYIYGPNVFAKAVGQGNGILRLEVPQGILMHVGDAVVIPAARGIYGVIEYIESYPSNPAQFAFVSQKPALSSLRFVAVDRRAFASFSQEEADAVVKTSVLVSATTTNPFTEILSEIDTTGTSTPE